MPHRSLPDRQFFRFASQPSYRHLFFPQTINTSSCDTVEHAHAFRSTLLILSCLYTYLSRLQRATEYAEYFKLLPSREDFYDTLALDIAMHLDNSESKLETIPSQNQMR